MKILSDIKDFMITLDFVDFVFFFAVLILMVLIVTLIYFIKINDDVLDNSDVKEETQEMKIVKEINKNLAQGEPTVNIEFTDYEKDQEEKAIISYEELLDKGSSNYAINYEKEDYYDDLSVKKFDLGNLVNVEKEERAAKIDVRVISFAKEEAFLQALKQLQKELG